MSTSPPAQSVKRTPAKRKPSSRRRENGRTATLLALLRDASPPFGRTAEVKRAWVEARDNELNKQ